MNLDPDAGGVVGQALAGGGDGDVVVGPVEEVEQGAAVGLVEEMKLVDAQANGSQTANLSLEAATLSVGCRHSAGSGAFAGPEALGGFSPLGMQ